AGFSCLWACSRFTRNRSTLPPRASGCNRNMTDLIASRKNPLIRRIRKLDSDAAFRRREGLFLLWGAKPVEEAMADPSRVGQLVIGETVSRQRSLRPLLRA